MGFVLVCANKSDIKAINELMRKSKSYWGYDEEFINKFMRHFQVTPASFDKSITKLLYDKQDTGSQNLVGFYSLCADPNNHFELVDFFVHPNFIGKGFGKKLWIYLLETIHKLGKQEFIVWSDPFAEGFYEKMGCEKIGTRESPMMPGRHPAVFKYSL